MHHIAAIIMQVSVLTLGNSCPIDLCCKLAIALLGTTGANILIHSQIDFTPISH